VRRAAHWLARAGGDVLVLAAVASVGGYEDVVHLDDGGWRRLLGRLTAAHALVAEQGLRCVLHPHVGTAVERRDHVARVLDGSEVPLCLDTGHLLVGGSDPLHLAREAGDRIGHVQLKDVDGDLARAVGDRRLGYRDAVARGLYRPLGRGKVRVAEIVGALETRGYDGWYVLEQDVVLTEPPPAEHGPKDDVATSGGHLRALLANVERRAPERMR
jgi:inosose dehydratase